MADRKQKGDLAEILLVEHIDDPKRYCIQGRMKGYRKFHILARIGEGKDDIRSADSIRVTAESILKDIVDLYALDAFLKSRETV